MHPKTVAKPTRGRPRISPETRFFAKVDETQDCWIWRGAPTADGYGRFFDGEKKVLAHRYSWSLHGRAIGPKQELDHKCMNRLCVNPDHLRVATRKQQNENRVGACSNNPTGVRGVNRTKNGRPFQAIVHHNGERHYLGRFDSLADAEKAAVKKRLSLFTHNEADKKFRGMI